MALLGDPLAVVVWIQDSLTAENRQLKTGDLPSLGTVTNLTPAKAGTSLKARYIDLDPTDPVEISVRFE